MDVLVRAVRNRSVDYTHPRRYHNKEVSDDWLKCLLPVVTVDTLEKFWRVYLQMNPPSTVVMNREVRTLHLILSHPDV